MIWALAAILATVPPPDGYAVKVLTVERQDERVVLTLEVVNTGRPRPIKPMSFRFIVGGKRAPNVDIDFHAITIAAATPNRKLGEPFRMQFAANETLTLRLPSKVLPKGHPLRSAKRATVKMELKSPGQNVQLSVEFDAAKSRQPAVPLPPLTP